MRSLHRSLLPTALALASGLGLAAAPGRGVTQERGATQQLTQPPAAAPGMGADAVDPDAIAALKEMSAYLATLTSFEVHADTTRDLVTNNGHRIQLGGSTVYRVRRPDAFQIDVNTDYQQRRFFYDGKKFTIYAPTLGYYATADAPPTIHQTLDEVENRFGVEVPLVDLFRWNDPNSHESDDLTAAIDVGPATVDGVATDHYAFREKDRDWEIWIQQGAQPVPRKIVIIDRSDEARPTYTARMTWNVGTSFPAQTFAFTPGPDAKAIHLATLQQ